MAVNPIYDSGSYLLQLKACLVCAQIEDLDLSSNINVWLCAQNETVLAQVMFVDAVVLSVRFACAFADEM